MEKRHLGRFECWEPVYYQCRSHRTIGFVNEVSYGGLRMSCPILDPHRTAGEPLVLPCIVEVGSEITVVSLRPNVPAEARTLTGRVCWRMDNLQTGHREFGVQFSGEARNIFNSWVSRLLNQAVTPRQQALSLRS